MEKLQEVKLAFLGKIGKTLGLGSTGQVLGSVGLAAATGRPEIAAGAFRTSQMGSAAETAIGPNVQNTIETQTAGSEGYRNGFVQARTGGRGVITQIPTTIPEAIGLGIDYFFGGNDGDVCQPQGQKPFSVNI